MNLADVYFYMIRFDTCEESNKHVLGHRDKYTKERFYELVTEAALILMIEEPKKSYQIEMFMNQAEDRCGYNLQFEDLFDGIIEILKNRFGFFDLDITVEFKAGGWDMVLIKDTVHEAVDVDLRKFYQALQNDERLKKYYDKTKMVNRENEQT